MTERTSITNNLRYGFADWLYNRVQHIECVLDGLLPGASPHGAELLHKAMRQAVLGGGKRIRAALVYASAQACGAQERRLVCDVPLDYAAAAVELIHAYSLTHDDLPCMDNDVLRRGQPTTHIKFGEANAILAGDALQSLAFELLANMPTASRLVTKAVRSLAKAAGSHGMAGGQAIDLQSMGRTLTQDELQIMYGMKTGSVITCSIELGGLVSGASPKVLKRLSTYGSIIGLAFQVVDDILDSISNTDDLGKTAGKDKAYHKPNYVSLLGLQRARRVVDELHRIANKLLLPLDNAAVRLVQLTSFIVSRNH